jgi:hypothetical protein
MRKLMMPILAASAVLTQPAQAGESEGQVLGQWDPIRASYLIHSGGATYPEPPTKADRALTILIEGKAAKEVFDLMGPDEKVTCSSEKGDRERRNKGACCVYTAKLNNPKDFHYRCWIGVNLRTGDGDVRVSC